MLLLPTGQRVSAALGWDVQELAPAPTAKLLQIVADDPDRTELVISDGAADTGYVELEDTDWGDMLYEEVIAQGVGHLGGVSVDAIPQDRPIALVVRIYGSSPDDHAAKHSALARQVYLLRVHGGVLMRRLSGATTTATIRVLSGQSRISAWGRRAEVRDVSEARIELRCAPLWEGEEMDVSDDFATDTIASGDWTILDGGASAGTGVLVTDRVPAETRLRRARPRYPLAEWTGQLSHSTGAAVNAGGAIYRVGFLARMVDAGNLLRAEVSQQAGGNLSLAARQVVGGVATTIEEVTSPSVALASGAIYWLRMRLEQHLVIIEHHESAPTPTATPSEELIVELGGAALAASGDLGLVWLPSASDQWVSQFRARPFTRHTTTPSRSDWADPVPGDAPPHINTHVAIEPGLSAPAWALIGLSAPPLAHNFVWNGSFDFAWGADDSADGWSVASVANIASAGTSVLRTFDGLTYAARVDVPGVVAGEGAHFVCAGPARRGVTLRAQVSTRVEVGGPAMPLYLRLGGGTADVAQSALIPSSSVWATTTLEWTPTADYDRCYVAVISATATAGDWLIDSISVVPAADPPMIASQLGGRGAPPPLGVLESEWGIGEAAAGWVLGADASARGGQSLQYAGTGASVLSAYWSVDPALLRPDPRTPNTVQVECWGRLYVTQGLDDVRVAIGVVAGPGSPPTYSAEFGADGVQVEVPVGADLWRVVRLGTLALSVDRTTVWPATLFVSAALGAASSGGLYLDYLFLAPALRALGPTGITLDARYPVFVPSSSSFRREIGPDGRGRIALEPGQRPLVYHGLGLAHAIEPAPGPLALTLALSNRVPQDPAETLGDQLAHEVEVHAAVTPRWAVLRV